MTSGNIEAAFPLTPLQEGMLYHAIRSPGSGLYLSQYVIGLAGPLDPEALRAAWSAAVARHGSLRTFFAWERRERPLQVVRRSVELEFLIEDWRSLAEAEAQAAWTVRLARDRDRGMELSQAPLMRLLLVRLSDDGWRLLWTVHHAILDGWSGRMIVREVLADHARLLRGADADPTPAPNFDNFVGWIEAQDAAAAARYWRTELAELPARTPLPWDLGEPGGPERHYVEAGLDEAETVRLLAAAARARVTLNTMVVGAWALLLRRFEGRADVVFGTSVSERPPELAGMERAAGLYLTTVPVRARGIAPSSDAWLRDLQATLAQGRAHSAAGLVAIQRWAGAAAGRPLFDTLVVYESFPAILVGEDVSAGPPFIESETLMERSDSPLALLAFPGRRLRLTLVHDPQRISATGAHLLLSQLTGLLRVLMEDRALAETEVPTPDERPVLEKWSQPAVLEQPATDVLALIEEQAHLRPDAVALRTPDRSVTYRDMMRRAHQVAHRLLEARVGADPEREALPLVGILAERSPDAIIGMLGTLMAGAAFVPVDPAAGTLRIETMLASAVAVLTTPSGEAVLGRTTTPRIRLDQKGSAPVRGVRRAADPRAAAYVVFTSGSTGEPKGVVVERAQLAASTAARLQVYPEVPRSFLLMSALGVDSSVAGIWWTLTTGGTLVLPPARAEQDPAQLGRLLAEAQVTHTLLVPSLYRTLLEVVDPGRLASLRCVIVAGEACPPAVVDAHRARLPGVPLYNEYGPSETTVWATVDELTAAGAARVTIGRPIPGARAVLVDEQGRPVPPGAVGELCIGGLGVARGYLGDPERTGERFLPDPLGGDGRVYRTGDRSRFLEDGRLEFLGRTDDQLKVRGHRVEPVEVERLLEHHPSVREAAVTWAAPAANGDVEALVAALLPYGDAEIEALLTEAEEVR